MKLSLFAAIAAALMATQVFAGAAMGPQVYRGSIAVENSTWVPAVCVIAPSGHQCFTTDRLSMGRVPAGQIDNTLDVFDAGAAVAWAEAKFDYDFRPRFKTSKTYVLDDDGNRVIDTIKRNRW